MKSTSQNIVLENCVLASEIDSRYSFCTKNEIESSDSRMNVNPMFLFQTTQYLAIYSNFTIKKSNV